MCYFSFIYTMGTLRAWPLLIVKIILVGLFIIVNTWYIHCVLFWNSMFLLSLHPSSFDVKPPYHLLLVKSKCLNITPLCAWITFAYLVAFCLYLIWPCTWMTHHLSSHGHITVNGLSMELFFLSGPIWKSSAGSVLLVFLWVQNLLEGHRFIFYYSSFLGCEPHAWGCKFSPLHGYHIYCRCCMTFCCDWISFHLNCE